MGTLTGWKTFAFGLAVAVVPQILNFVGAYNWQSIGLSPNVGTAIGAVIVILRAVTNTPIFSSTSTTTSLRR